MAAGASPTGGVGGIFYFLLLVIGLLRRSYRRARRSLGSARRISPAVLAFALSAVALTNIIFVYKFVDIQLSSGTRGGGIGVQLVWQLRTEVFRVLSYPRVQKRTQITHEEAQEFLASVEAVAETVDPPADAGTERRIMMLISIVLLGWLPIAILESLHVITVPFWLATFLLPSLPSAVILRFRSVRFPSILHHGYEPCLRVCEQRNEH